MNRKDIKCSWTHLIQDVPKNPKGYSSVPQIARRMGLSTRAVSARLRRAREEGTVKAIQARSTTGRIIWFYKD